jgi:hypothetical protein
VEFHALFTFSPFSFIADISGGVDLRRGTRVIAGIHLSGTLSGPSPWRVKGEACISFLFFDVCVDFDRTFGGRITFTPLPSADLRDKLIAAIADERNWNAALPPAVERVVSTASPRPDPALVAPPVLVDPMGAIALSQRLLPLNYRIAKFDEAVLAKPVTFKVTGVLVGDSPEDFSLVQDFFAPGQFEVLSEDDKLSRPSFEKMVAGVAVASDAVDHGQPKEATVTYEDIIIDSPFDSRPVGPYLLPGANLLGMLNRGAATLGGFTTTGPRKFAPVLGSAALISFGDIGFVIASTSDLRARPEITPPTTKGSAAIALDIYLATHPEERGRLQIVPLHEAQEAP